MDITVKNRSAIEDGLNMASAYVLISISCPNNPARLPKDEKRIDVLRLEFDDLDSHHPNSKLFTRAHAKKILSFFIRHQDKVPALVVHCDAGVSRSPAVAAALTKIQGELDHGYFDRYYPNRRVYSLLLAEFYEEKK